MKPSQVFHPYQLHRDQLENARKYDLVCIGSPSSEDQPLSDDCFDCSFRLIGDANRFRQMCPMPSYNGCDPSAIYFVPRAEAKKRGLKWTRVPFARSSKADLSAQIAALEEENKTLRETLAKIAALAGESK